ncbi:MAG: PadR family transcriptional regulator [Acidobacteria bacterium]|nr:PadR family transcriptional regulator [Acidobacteriota bacterium]
MPLQEAAFHILVALADADKHGYAIMQDVTERTRGAVRLNVGTLYSTIKRLLETGWIEELDERPSEDDERRRYYRLTEVGRAEVRAEAARLEQMLLIAKRAGLAPRKV